MNDNAKKWAEALESGDYAQTNGILKRYNIHGEPSYCCLGVACELFIADGGKLGEQTNDGLGTVTFVHDGGEDQSLLPEPVRDWLELKGSLGDYSDEWSNNSLAGLNDRGHPFKEIAEIIKSEPAGLFVDA